MTAKMHYCTYPPSEPLSRYVKLYWTLEECGPTTAIRERVFPDGCMELIFHYGDLFRRHTDTNSIIQPRSFVHGQLIRYMDIESTGRIGIFGVRFFPHGLRAFSNIDANELTGNAIGIEDLWGPDGLVLQQQILAAPLTVSRIKIIEAFLLGVLRQHLESAVGYCVSAIVNSSGLKSIQVLSQEVNLSRRHLERSFNGAVGMSPKMFARIVRFQHALNRVEKDHESSLTGIAYSSGFYDQSHFIKDFKEFSGLNPRLYFKADIEFAKYFTFE
jgi:AraC-like DNA-binding protein